MFYLRFFAPRIPLIQVMYRFQVCTFITFHSKDTFTIFFTNSVGTVCLKNHFTALGIKKNGEELNLNAGYIS